jgi:predicted O-linked N-acetylglucosamine transferase (SPINDLY family)
VGYLSPRFGEGPLASFFLPVLEGHDPREFEVFLYSAYPHRSTLAERMRAACRDWRDLPASDEHAMAMLREDDLDVLVDLAGHTPGGRLGVLARRAAPVQVTWLDWFDTTGLSAIDYLLSDSIHTPENFAPYFSERLVLMRDCRFVYRPVVAPLASIAPSSINGYVTFGCFNRHAKISDDAIRLWSRVLESVPDARLHLRASAYGGSGTVDHVRARWRAMGVPVERIEFLPYVPLREALASYANIDIALDPFPYNGGVTTCDALAQGVPVVALIGDTMIARQSAALLQAARRPQWIAATPDDYVRVACDLARPDAIAGTRADLFNTFAHSPLCDVTGFVTALETTLDHLCQLGPANGDRHSPLVCA